MDIVLTFCQCIVTITDNRQLFLLINFGFWTSGYLVKYKMRRGICCIYLYLLSQWQMSNFQILHFQTIFSSATKSIIRKKHCAALADKPPARVEHVAGGLSITDIDRYQGWENYKNE